MGKDFLSIIVDHKKDEVAAAKKNMPESQIVEQAKLQQEKRPFYDTLKDPGPEQVNIIAEIKRASPSKGDICPNLDPAAYASRYEQGGAAALSVLTDEKFFKGGFKDFKSARQATRLPMLRKDFLISSYQIYESKVLGADAVLLIVRILSRAQLKDYIDLCGELNLDCLVEIHTLEDLENALYAKAKLIGINNRNLSSFETNLSTAMSIASRLGPDQTPVAASGIRTRQDIEENRKNGINTFLIGESLVRADDPAAFIKHLKQ